MRRFRPHSTTHSATGQRGRLGLGLLPAARHLSTRRRNCAPLTACCYAACAPRGWRPGRAPMDSAAEPMTAAEPTAEELEADIVQMSEQERILLAKLRAN